MLLGFFLAVVVLEDLPVVHDHDGPGLYDEDCPLERLAAAVPRVSLPQPFDTHLPAAAPDPVLASPVGTAAGVSLPPFKSRAPPVLDPRCRLAQ